jgi:hypothetical protein
MTVVLSENDMLNNDTPWCFQVVPLFSVKFIQTFIPPFTVLVDGLVSLYFGLQVAGYAQLRPQKKLIKSSLFHGFSPIFGILKVFFNEFKCPKCRASHFFTRSMPIFCRLNHNILLVNYDQLPISSNPLDSAEPFPSPICVGLEIWSLR